MQEPENQDRFDANKVANIRFCITILLTPVPVLLFSVQIDRVTEASQACGSALYAISVARIRTDAASGAQSPGDRTNSGFHQRTLPMGRTFMTIARGALPLRGGHMRLRLRASVLRLHSCGVFAFSNILLLRLNLEPSASCDGMYVCMYVREHVRGQLARTRRHQQRHRGRHAQA